MRRVFFTALALAILLGVFLFQRFDYAGVINFFLPDAYDIIHPYFIFCVNKTCRLIFNDLACLVLIFAWFHEKSYLRVAFFLFLFELFVLLPLYLYVKLNVEGSTEMSSPLLSHLHRLIVNPLLMLLLIMGFIYQRVRFKKT